MGMMKTFDIRIRNGGDDAIQAVTELIDMERHNTAIRVGMECRKWIPVDERLPKDRAEVLLHYDDGSMEVGKYTGLGAVIAWMPLPEPLERKQGRAR
jgi:hypothetical protein